MAPGLSRRGGGRRGSLAQHPWLGWAPGSGTPQKCSNNKAPFKANAAGFPITLGFEHSLQTHFVDISLKDLTFSPSTHPGCLLPSPHDCLGDKANKNNMYLPCPSFVYIHGILILRGKGILYTIQWVVGHTFVLKPIMIQR